MFSVNFKLLDNKLPLDGYEIGYITLSDGNQLIDASSGGSRHLKMLFLSIVELLDGLNTFLRSKKKTFEYVGVDSSFILVFRKLPKHAITISYGNSTTLKVSESDLIAKLTSESERFWQENRYLFVDSSPVIDDMEGAIKAFSALKS